MATGASRGSVRASLGDRARALVGPGVRGSGGPGVRGSAGPRVRPLPAGDSTRRRGAVRRSRLPSPRSAEARRAAQGSLRRTIKDYDVVDGEEKCTAVRAPIWRLVLCASAVPPHLRVESAAQRRRLESVSRGFTAPAVTCRNRSTSAEAFGQACRGCQLFRAVRENRSRTPAPSV